MRATLVTRFQVPDTVLLTVVTLCCAASVYNLLICVRETLYSVNTPPSSSPQRLATAMPLSPSVTRTLLGPSCRWNQAVIVLE